MEKKWGRGKKKNKLKKKFLILKKSKKRWGVGEMSRCLETNHIRSQQTVPLFTEGKLKGSNVKGLQHFKMI